MITKSKADAINTALLQQLSESISITKEFSYLFLEIKYKLKSTIYREKFNGVVENRSFFWINGLYAYGLLSTGDTKDIEALDRFYSKVRVYNFFCIIRFNMPDTVLHAYVMMRLIVDYGKEKYISIVHKAAEYIKSEASISNNLIRYRKSSRNFLVDSMGMIIGFCYLYGSTYNDKDLINIADNQVSYTIRMINKYHSTFPYHAYVIDTDVPSGTCTWGRGIGWFLIGLTEAAINNPDKFQNEYQAYIDKIFEYQSQEGYFYDDFSEKRNIDTSITSMAALCLALGLKYNLISGDINQYYDKLELCICALGDCCTDSGEVMNCSGESNGAGRYSTDFGNYFAQGYTLALFYVFNDLQNLSEADID